MKRRSKRRGHRHGRPFPPPPKATPVEAPSVPTGDVRFLSKQEVLEKVNVKPQSLWTWIMQGHFPPAREYGIAGGKRSKIGWLSSEVDQWMLGQPRRVPSRQRP